MLEAKPRQTDKQTTVFPVRKTELNERQAVADRTGCFITATEGSFSRFNHLSSCDKYSLAVKMTYTYKRVN